VEALKFLFTSSFYPPYHIGGDAVHVNYLAKELSDRGHEVHVLHSLDAYVIKTKMVEQQTESPAIHAHTIKTALQLSPYVSYLLGNDPRVIRRFRSLVKEIKPNVVHHHNISLLGYNILRRSGGYVNLYTAHDYWLFCQLNNLFKYGRYVCKKHDCLACSLGTGRPRQIWRYLPMFRRAIHEIDAVIAPSRFMLQTLKHEFSSLRIDHIPNFAPRTDLDVPTSTPAETPYFVYVGVLEEPKGLLPLLDFYSKWASNRKVKLKIVGTGSLAAQIGRFIDKRKMQDYALILGRLPTNSVRRELLNAVALICPSLWPENAPLTALEALSVGTPVVASKTGGLPEIVEHVDARLLFSWHGEDGLDRALEFAIDHNSSLRNRAKTAFANLFSPERYMKTYFDLIRSLSVQ
jgi:glycosyltransferase involved in cell wall biosynthesis